ncbi:MAG: hypothetical protein KA085_04040 [Phenylobacterium sp.]|jgi:hypothetical protein|uniref:hypothetical protein n=1 Tax=Phenylobacterium sp. TaxID=1871053 RepID=UPI001B46C950|nr:hypothetical protein [Phenylobacterium sp.]MBP7648909.1 hypothetical protein [Phenylobacterium sp.]MBP7815271.1 hypothetical protein [Phenylobacterium sp.]MBP9756070.1 hypothetical protein [Phenylobacterium sp.]
MGAQTQTVEVLEASVSSMVGVLAWEIELAGARCMKLDTLVGELMHILPLEHREKLVEGMHTVDLLGQQLTALSSFARNLSDEIPETIMAPVEDALGDITLGALADRMFSALGGEEKGLNDGDEAGDLDLF